MNKCIKLILVFCTIYSYSSLNSCVWAQQSDVIQKHLDDIGVSKNSFIYVESYTLVEDGVNVSEQVFPVDFKSSVIIYSKCNNVSSLNDLEVIKKNKKTYDGIMLKNLELYGLYKDQKTWVPANGKFKSFNDFQINPRLSIETHPRLRNYFELLKKQYDKLKPTDNIEALLETQDKLLQFKQERQITLPYSGYGEDYVDVFHFNNKGFLEKEETFKNGKLFSLKIKKILSQNPLEISDENIILHSSLKDSDKKINSQQLRIDGKKVFGFLYAKVSGKWKIIHIVKGSSAEKNGLVEGMEILKINSLQITDNIDMKMLRDFLVGKKNIEITTLDTLGQIKTYNLVHE